MYNISVEGVVLSPNSYCADLGEVLGLHNSLTSSLLAGLYLLLLKSR